jgi:hypothetical protein
MTEFRVKCVNYPNRQQSRYSSIIAIENCNVDNEIESQKKRNVEVQHGKWKESHLISHTYLSIYRISLFLRIKNKFFLSETYLILFYECNLSRGNT